jgi:hypothetical protein
MGFFVTVAFVLSLIAFFRAGALSSRVKRLEARLSTLENEKKIRDERVRETVIPEQPSKEKAGGLPFGTIPVQDAPSFAPPQKTAVPVAEVKKPLIAPKTAVTSAPYQPKVAISAGRQALPLIFGINRLNPVLSWEPNHYAPLCTSLFLL